MKSSRLADGAAFAVLPAVSTSVGEKWTEASKRGGQCCPAREEKQEKGGAGGRIFFARSRVAPKHWSLASSLCVASALCDSEKRTTLSMSGSGHRGVLHAISKSNAPQLLNYCRHSRRNRRRRENARLRVFPQENSCLIFLAEKKSYCRSGATDPILSTQRIPRGRDPDCIYTKNRWGRS